MTAPLDFGRLPRKPAEAQSASKPLDFGAAKPAPKKQPDVVMTSLDPFDFRQIASPPAAPPAPSVEPRKLEAPRATTAPKTLDFGAIPSQQKSTPAAKPQGPVTIQASFVDKTDAMVPQVLKLVESTHPELYADAERRMKVEVQVKQLLPLTIPVVITWGEKPLSYLSTQTTSVTNLIREISGMKAYETVEEAQKSVTASPSLFQRMKFTDHVLAYKPKLAAIRSNIGRWLSEADRLIVDTKRTEVQMTTCMATFSSVLTFLGQIPDSSLELASSQRRMTLTQAAIQAQSLVLQVEQQQKMLYTMKNMLDTFLDVTLPAYESAKAR